MQQGFDLRAGEIYPSIWIPGDPADIATYYPQAVFRNALSFTVIGTVNLTKQSDGSYKGNFQVPQDPSGLGMIIVETLIVYNDNGHTDSATQYSIEQIKHKIVNATVNFGGGGGVEINYDYLKEMVQKIVNEAVATIHFEQKEIDLSELIKLLKQIKETQDPQGYALSNITGVLDELNGKKIDFPKGEYEKHFSNLNGRVLTLENSFNGHREELKKEVVNLMKKYLDSLHIADHDAFNKSHKELKQKIDDAMQNMFGELKYRFDGIHSFIPQPSMIKEWEDREQKPRKKEIDFAGIAKNLIG